MPLPLEMCTHGTCGCAHLKRQRHRAWRIAFNLSCAAAFAVRCSPLEDDTVSKASSCFADMLFTQGLMALMPPTIYAFSH